MTEEPLNKFPGWPNGDNKPIMEISAELKELSSTLGFELNRDRDNLDWYEAGHIIDGSIGPIVFMKHDHSPAQGVIAYVDCKVGSATAIEFLKNLLLLKKEDIAWVTKV